MAINTDALNDDGSDIAIIGMGCRFPGASGPNEFWRNLASGHESLSELDEDQLRQAGVPRTLISDPNYVSKGMFLEGHDLFDPAFFGLSTIEADVMDPQHRQFLMCAWETFEDAGKVPQRFDGSIGAFAGSGHNRYFFDNVLGHADVVANQGFFLLRHTGNDKDFLATRLAYCLDLKGPVASVQTACSTSLVAVHLAVQSLLSDECDMALAGGVTIELPTGQGYLYRENEILSKDGHCRPFDANSSGTIFSSGVGCVLLRRLEDAIADGDNIQAIIKATAVNNDGSQKVSYLAPGVDGQAAVLEEALDLAGFEPNSVGYIECHGTGTQLGDPIEFAALGLAYQDVDNGEHIGLGAVKSNIGHTDNAAGVAGLIKLVQSLKHQQLAPTLHFNAANPAIDLERSPFYVVDKLREWQSTGPRRGGVTSLGVGGTNAHVLLEEAPKHEPPTTRMGTNRPTLLLFSARSTSSLSRYTTEYSTYLSDAESKPDLIDMAYTLATGRQDFEHRRFVVVDDVDDAVTQLEKVDNTITTAAAINGPTSRLGFMFAGGGAQYPNMGLGLYESEPVYRAAIDECHQLLTAIDASYDLRGLLFPPSDRVDSMAMELQRPSRSLPALFSTQYANSQLWADWGITPDVLLGHSMGENTAACIAGVMQLKDALGLVLLRGRLFESVAAGGMLSVELSTDELASHLGSLDIAAINSPNLSVVSGPEDQVSALALALQELDVGHQRIHINVAAHSRMLDGILDEFGDYLRSIDLRAPEIPIVSNRTGTWLTDQQAQSPDYWVQHLRHTVNFADGVGELLSAGDITLLEVGPGRVLSSLASAHPNKTPQHGIVRSLRRPDEAGDDTKVMVESLANLWCANAKIDWKQFYADKTCQTVSLPTYRFDYTKHWLEETARGQGNERGDDVPDWLYRPNWQNTQLPPLATTSAPSVLVFGDDDVLKDILALPNCISVQAGSQYSGSRDTGYTIAPGNADDYVRLVRDLVATGELPNVFASAFALQAPGFEPDGPLATDSVFEGPLYLAQAMLAEDVAPDNWLLVTRGACAVQGADRVNPVAALSLGVANTISAEMPDTRCWVLDVGHTHSVHHAQWLRQELECAADAQAIAYRGSYRYAQSFERVQLGSASVFPTRINSGGTYLITGGLGGLGIAAAEAIAQEASVTLVLTGRSRFPDREYWQELVRVDAPERQCIETIQRIEQLGSTVHIHQVDIADPSALRELREQIEATQTQPLAGILHTAGVLDDQLLLNKDIDAARRVLKPKVDGTLALDRVFDFSTLDFCILYSSTSAYNGLPGQFDYAAANAFLDSYAAYSRDRGALGVCSVNWPAWKDIGMAAGMLSNSANVRQPAGRPLQLPAIDRVIEESDTEAIYSTLYSTKRYWLLDEHRVANGSALIPGTGYLELARSVFFERFGESAITFSEVRNELPFFVADGEIRELRLRLEGDASDTRYTFFTLDEGEELVCAGGRLQRTTIQDASNLDIKPIRNRCNNRTQRFDDPDHHPMLNFGERWRALEVVHIGNAEALIDLNQNDEHYASDADYALHPAVLDMATAGAQILIPDYQPSDELFVPVGFDELVWNGTRLPKVLHSHVRLAPAEDTNQVKFDVDVVDSSGSCIVSVQGFTLQRVDGLLSAGQSQPSQDDNLENSLQLGVSQAEGHSALDMIIRRGLGPQILVSPYPIDHYFAEIRRPHQLVGSKDTTPVHDPDADPDISIAEALLASHESVSEIVVRSHLDLSGQRRLIAHFTVDPNSMLTVSEIRKFARNELDAVLVPQHFVEVDRFSRDTEGQIDRCAYPDPFAPVDTYVAPATQTEKKIATIWRSLLGTEKVSRNDNFFDIGGHSLVSTRAIIKIQKQLGATLNQAQMALMTLEQIADEIDGAGATVEQTAEQPEKPTAKGFFGNLLSRRS